MKRILLIHSSLFGDDSASTGIAQSLVERLLREHPGSKVTTLDLAREALPHLAAEEFNSWLVPEEQRDAGQRSLAVISDRLIDQLMSHDVLILAVPMYNLGIPSTLKVWIDRVSRAGKTFAYTSDGPKGLVRGMQAYLVLSRGGLYRGTPLDTQTGYLTSVLGLMGITDVETIFAEGLNMGGDTRQKSIDAAMAKVRELPVNEHEEYGYAAA
ncbi:MAG: FMN-dependent NADH-azoreductase [Xanthomonadales bacterium]|nr:FMN-dependent NADH-azoreductase [Xanthomonadales bacterium]